MGNVPVLSCTWGMLMQALQGKVSQLLQSQ